MDEPLINGETTIDTGELVLHHAPSTALPGNEDGSTDYPKITNFYEAKAICWLETQKLWAIAGPIAFNILCVYGINSVTQIFVGHIGDVELSAIAIAMSVISNFSFGFLLGMGSALETLCGQAFGAGQIFMLGVYMQRSWIILIVTCIILSPIYIFSAPVLKLLGQEEDIAELAGRFAIQIIPQMFSLAINFPTQKFLQSQSKVSVLAYIGAFALVGYVVRWCTDGWTGLSMLAFNEIWAFVRLSLASAVMLCLEVWYMMVLVVLTGHLKNAVIAVGSISICMNINGWEAMLFIGINAAISVRVSNELGSGHPRAAKYSVLVVILESLLIGIFFMILILVTKDDFSIIFTSSKDLQNAVSKLAPLLGVTMVLNSVQPVISGVAVGGGWQALVAYINLGCYYVFGLPLGFLLGYVLKWGVQGIWIGMLWGTALQTGVLLVIIWKTNWNKEASQASERVRMWGGVD
ncbi:Protein DETOXIFICATION 34 [Ranunculus cassubicifolius]